MSEIENTIQDTLNDGIMMGLKECKMVLNILLTEKVNRGHAEYITKTELNAFLDEYILQASLKNK